MGNRRPPDLCIQPRRFYALQARRMSEEKSGAWYIERSYRTLPDIVPVSRGTVYECTMYIIVILLFSVKSGCLIFSAGDFCLFFRQK